MCSDGKIADGSSYDKRQNFPNNTFLTFLSFRLLMLIVILLSISITLSSSHDLIPLVPTSPILASTSKKTYIVFLQKFQSKIALRSRVINRPGVAGAVLQTALYLYESVMICENIFTVPQRLNGWKWCLQ